MPSVKISTQARAKVKYKKEEKEGTFLKVVMVSVNLIKVQEELRG